MTNGASRISMADVEPGLVLTNNKGGSSYSTCGLPRYIWFKQSEVRGQERQNNEIKKRAGFRNPESNLGFNSKQVQKTADQESRN